MANLHRNLDVTSPSPGGSVIFGFLVVVAASLGAFIWVGGGGGKNFDGGIRVYQAPQTALQTAEAEPPASGIDESIKTSSVATSNTASQ